MFEVEKKFRVQDLEPTRSSIRRKLEICEVTTLVQEDHYFEHPSRNLAASDEALRIRTAAGKCFLTYKGPRSVRSRQQGVKTRAEIEIPFELPECDSQGLSRLFSLLGFRSVLVVRKRREDFRTRWKGRAISIALDEVERLGCFVEIEVVSSEQDLRSAEAIVHEISQNLGLQNAVGESYAELLRTLPPGDAL